MHCVSVCLSVCLCLHLTLEQKSIETPTIEGWLLLAHVTRRPVLRSENKMTVLFGFCKLGWCSLQYRTVLWS